MYKRTCLDKSSHLSQTPADQHEHTSWQCHPLIEDLDSDLIHDDNVAVSKFSIGAPGPLTIKRRTMLLASFVIGSLCAKCLVERTWRRTHVSKIRNNLACEWDRVASSSYIVLALVQERHQEAVANDALSHVASTRFSRVTLIGDEIERSEVGDRCIAGFDVYCNSIEHVRHDYLEVWVHHQTLLHRGNLQSSSF